MMLTTARNRRGSIEMVARLFVFAAAGWIGACIAYASPDTDPGLRDYLSATGLLNRGMNDLAIAEYRKFLSEHPEHEKAALGRYGLGVALFRTQAYDDAITELSHIRGLSSFEFGAEVKLILGQSYLEKQEYSKASQALRELLEQHADHDQADDAAALLAESLYRGGDPKAVAEPCQLIATRWPESPLRERAELFGGLALVAQENYVEAAKAFGEMRKRFPKGQYVDRATLLLAQSLHRTGGLEEAAR